MNKREPAAGATEMKIYRLSAICGVLTALAFVIPRFVPNQEGGFVSATVRPPEVLMETTMNWVVARTK